MSTLLTCASYELTVTDCDCSEWDDNVPSSTATIQKFPNPLDSNLEMTTFHPLVKLAEIKKGKKFELDTKCITYNMIFLINSSNCQHPLLRFSQYGRDGSKEDRETLNGIIMTQTPTDPTSHTQTAPVSVLGYLRLSVCVCCCLLSSVGISCSLERSRGCLGDVWLVSGGI